MRQWLRLTANSTLWTVTSTEKSSPYPEILMALTADVDDGTIRTGNLQSSSAQLKGIANLLDDMVEYFPKPNDRKKAGILTKSNEVS